VLQLLGAPAPKTLVALHCLHVLPPVIRPR
jgi:hypothetical protein